MQEFSVDNASMTDFLAVVAEGKPFRLCQRGKVVGVVSPQNESLEERSAFMQWVMEWRDRNAIDEHGFTEEESEAMRDRSPAPKPMSFD